MGGLHSHWEYNATDASVGRGGLQYRFAHHWSGGAGLDEETRNKSKRLKTIWSAKKLDAHLGGATVVDDLLRAEFIFYTNFWRGAILQQSMDQDLGSTRVNFGGIPRTDFGVIPGPDFG